MKTNQERSITMNNYCLLIVGILILSLLSCDNASQVENLSFYHWKTQAEFTQKSKDIIQQAKSNQLYIRFFDVSVDPETQQILPKATVQFDEQDNLPVTEIVPVVYITNQVFQQANHQEAIDDLAENILHKIQRLLKNKLPEQVRVSEIQIDCDWTPTTRAAYFSFLRSLKQQSAYDELEKYQQQTIDLSVTLRLHQVKYYQKTGVPPAEKKVLMLYNMGDLGKLDEHNSILNLTTTQQYITHLDRYPETFDLAFPFYSWGVLYRDNKLTGLIAQLDEERIKQNFKQQTANLYTATNDSYIDGTFIYKGDQLRLESVDVASLKQLKNLVDEHYSKKYSVILYHLNSNAIQTCDTNQLLQIFLP